MQIYLHVSKNNRTFAQNYFHLYSKSLIIMRKIYSIFAAVLFAGSMMAAETPKVTLDFTSGGVVGANPWGLPNDYLKKTVGNYTKGAYTISFAATDDGHKAMYNAIKENNVATGDTIWQGLIFGKKDATLTLPAMNFNVSKIIVYWVLANGSSAVVHNIYVGSNAVSTAVTGCAITENADSSVFNIAATSQNAGTNYALKVTSKHNMQVSKIEFYEAVAGAPEDPTFSIAAGVYDAAQTVALSCPTAGADIYYTLDETEPTSASTKYTSALNISSTTVIKAVAIKNALSSNVVTARYKIITLEGNGTKENPYTVADINALENSRPDSAWVKGYTLGSAKAGGLVEDTIAGTNLALGDVADQTIACIAVELPKGDIRNALSLKGYPEYVGKQIKVYGALQTYFSAPGVKGTSDYEFISGPATAINEIEATEQKALKIVENGQLFIIKNGIKYNAQGTIVK